MKQLNTDVEKTTKQIFNMLKKKWRNLLKKDDSSLWHLSIDKPILLERKNAIFGVDKFSDINDVLLERALVAYALRQHHINVKLWNVEIKCYHIVDTQSILLGSLMDFLKLNLSLMRFDKGNKLGCGIKYKIDNEILSFYGIPNEDIIGTRILVQIVKRGGRVLKEMIITGMKEQEEILELPIVKGLPDEESVEIKQRRGSIYVETAEEFL